MDEFFLSVKRGRSVPTGFFIDLPGPPPELAALRERVRVRARHLAALHLVPPIRSRRWSAAADPDFGAHVFEQTGIPDGQSFDEATSALVSRPLPGGRHPGWDVWLLVPTSRHRHRICFRINHALQDGVGAAHSAAALLADDTASGPRPHVRERPTAAGAWKVCRDVHRALRPGAGWTAWRAPQAGITRWVYADVEEQQIQAVARAWDGTVNDIFLSALTRACALWHTAHAPGRAAPNLTAVMPMSVRPPGSESTAGNHIVLTCLSLPTSATTPERCVAQVMRQTRAGRDGNHRDTVNLFYTKLPARWLAALHLRMRTPLIASHVNLLSPYRVFGAPVAAASMFSDLAQNLGCYVSLTRIGGHARCAVVYDLALPGAAALPQLWLDALMELADAAAAGPPPSAG
ncbi:MAG: wax ester/triacylglycerol synthase domain-containing protein [Streptomyces sp.]